MSASDPKPGGGTFETIDTRFIDTLPVAAYICDRDGRIVHVNPRAVTIWGREAAPDDRYCGSRRLWQLDGLPLAHDQSPMADVLRTGKVLQDVDYIVERDEKIRIAVRATVAPLVGPDGGVIGAINTFQDISPLKRAEAVRARLAAIVDSSDDAVVGKTLEGIITSWNIGASRIFGYTAKEAIGQHISFIVPVDRLAEEEDVLARLRRGERIDHFETVRRAKDGRLLDISLTVSPIRDGDGRIIGASKVARDITERRQAHEAVSASQHRYRRIFESAGVSLWEQDFTLVKQALDELRANGVTDVATWLEEHPEDVDRFIQLVRVVDVNQATVDMLRAADKDTVLNSFAALMDDSNRQVFVSELVAIARGETRFHGEARLRTFEGDRLDVLFNVTFPTSGEPFDSVLVSLTDITLRKQIEEELTEQIQVAQVANRTKDEFLATLSHELRTPLNAVLGWSHMLRTGTLSPDLQRRAFEAIERNARAQAQLVDDLLDVSRIVSGRLLLTMADVDLAAVVHSAIDTVRLTIAAKGLELDVFAPPAQRVIVGGDPDRLRQVFWNLLSNAVKFTPRGGRIRIDLAVHEHAAEVVVQDTGQGMNPDFLRHAFERFRQADSTASRRHGGLGLGLAIVRHLTEAHGGTVAAASEGDGRGATFTVRLPLRGVTTRTDAPPLRPVRSTTFGGLTILVVDDEPDAREFLRVLLQSHGARVEAAASAGEALEMLAREPVDLLLADLAMPDQDGYSLMEAIHELGQTGGNVPPAVAVTAYAGAEERARALAAGYAWHVTKPVDAEHLLSVVAAATQRSAG